MDPQEGGKKKQFGNEADRPRKKKKEDEGCLNTLNARKKKESDRPWWRRELRREKGGRKTRSNP